MCELTKELQDARAKAEAELGFAISDEVCEKVLAYTKRKLEVIRAREEKPDWYLAVLFENEIRDHCMRTAINVVSAMCREACYVH